jgi:hypothetical protein
MVRGKRTWTYNKKYEILRTLPWAAHYTVEAWHLRVHLLMTVVAGPEPAIKAGLISSPDAYGLECRNSMEKKGNPHSEFEAIDLKRLRQRACFYAKWGGASDDVVGEAAQLLRRSR